MDPKLLTRLEAELRDAQKQLACIDTHGMDAVDTSFLTRAMGDVRMALSLLLLLSNASAANAA